MENCAGKKNNKYSMAFTTCSLLHKESVEVARLFIELRDWQKVSKIATEKNILQYRTESSLKRTLSEILSRLKLLPTDAMEIIVNGYYQEQLHLLWFATCLRYPFISEFAAEVVREKYLIMQYELTNFDYDSFFNSKMNWHEELESITDTTKNKLRQVIFKMLKESEIVNKDNYILSTILSDKVKKIICDYNSDYLRVFPN